MPLKPDYEIEAHIRYCEDRAEEALGNEKDRNGWQSLAESWRSLLAERARNTRRGLSLPENIPTERNAIQDNNQQGGSGQQGGQGGRQGGQQDNQR